MTTLEQVDYEAVYAKTGLRPLKRAWFASGRACPLGAALVYLGVVDKNGDNLKADPECRNYLEVAAKAFGVSVHEVSDFNAKHDA